MEEKITRRLFDSLTPRQRKILGMRLSGISFQEIGKEFGVTRERVRQIEYQAMREIRVYDKYLTWLELQPKETLGKDYE